jgi:broad specificity phosphatase PhoE
LCGWLDLPLSPRGVAQLAAFFKERRKPVPPDALYCSPLRRARATAQALSEAWSIPITVFPGLREIHCGHLEGVAIERVQREHAALWARNAAQQDDEFAWPGGESYGAFRERAVAALQAIVALHRGQTVVAVTHTGVISQALGVLYARRAAEWDHHRPRPFSATEMVWHGDGPGSVLGFDRYPWW